MIFSYLAMQWPAVITYRSLTRAPPQNPPIESLFFLKGPVRCSAAIQGNSLCPVGCPFTILAIPLLLGIPQPEMIQSMKPTMRAWITKNVSFVFPVICFIYVNTLTIIFAIQREAYVILFSSA